MKFHFELATALKAYSLLGSIRNRVLNSISTFLCGAGVSVDWRDLKIVKPKSIKIGKNFSAGRSLWLESVDGKGRLVIGNDVNVSDYVHIGCASSVEIMDGVLIGSKVLITDHSHGQVGEHGASTILTPPQQRPIISKGKVSIGRFVWIGDSVCVMGGVDIGEGAVIGANSVVVRDVPSRTVWAGVPARQIWPATDNVPTAGHSC